MIVLEQLGRSSHLSRGSDSHFSSDVAHDTGPLIRVTVLFTKFAKRQYGKSILEQLHSDKNMKIKHIHLRFFIRLDFSIGCHHCFWVI